MLRGHFSGNRLLAAGEDRHELILKQRGDMQTATRGGQRHQREVQTVFFHSLENAVRVAGADPHIQLCKATAQCLQHGRQQMNAGGCAGTDRNLSGNAAGVTGQLQQGVFDHRLNARNMLQQRSARRGGLEPLAYALDQFQVQLVLQLPNLQAYRWLGQVQSLGRCGEAAVRYDQREGMQVIQVESAHGKVFLML